MANVEFVVAVAWDFQPGSERREGYFIQRRRSKTWPWALWAYVYDDNWETWQWLLRVTDDGAYPDAGQAARALLAASWRWERDQWQTDEFDEVEYGGLINEAEAWAMGASNLSQES